MQPKAHDRLAGSASATQFTSAVGKYVILKAPLDNTAPVYIGLSNGVTAGNGFPLDPGEETGFLLGGNLNELWYISAAGEDIAYLLLS
jgi:hypothetical protein